MANGILTDMFSQARAEALPKDDWRRRSPNHTEPGLSLNLALRDALRPIASRHETTVSAIAVAWAAAWPGVTGAIVGARSAQQVDGWLPAGSLTLAAADLGIEPLCRVSCVVCRVPRKQQPKRRSSSGGLYGPVVASSLSCDRLPHRRESRRPRLGVTSCRRVT
jgi:hypothetical protein